MPEKLTLAFVERPAMTFTNIKTGAMSQEVLDPIRHVAYLSPEAIREHVAYFLGWEYITRTNDQGFITAEGWKNPAGKTRLYSPGYNGWDFVPAPRFTGAKQGEVLAACSQLGWGPKLETKSVEGESYFFLHLDPLTDGRALLKKKAGEAICTSFLIAAWQIQDADALTTTSEEALHAA